MQVPAENNAEVGHPGTYRPVETVGTVVAGASQAGGQLGDRRPALFGAGHAGPLWRVGRWWAEATSGGDAATGNVVA